MPDMPDDATGDTIKANARQRFMPVLSLLRRRHAVIVRRMDSIVAIACIFLFACNAHAQDSKIATDIYLDGAIKGQLGISANDDPKVILSFRNSGRRPMGEFNQQVRPSPAFKSSSGTPVPHVGRQRS